MAVVGLVTIGQAPREELAGELRAVLPAGADVVQSGALDRATAPELLGLRPRSAGSTLITTLRDGRDVTVDRDLLVPLVEDAIQRVEAAECDVTVLACTDVFPALRHRAPLLHAGALLETGAAALATGVTTVGVIAPLPEQGAGVAAQWRRALGAEVLVAFADPYDDSSEARVRNAAGSLVRRGAELLLLDCMGYRSSHRVASLDMGAPVVLARSLVARMVAEFVSGLKAATRS